MAISILALSCSTKNDPEQKHEVIFKLPQLAVETEPMGAPIRKAPVLQDDDGQQMTDLYIFDGDEWAGYQKNTDSDFGTITLMLTAGIHHLHFIATRSTGLAVLDSVLSCGSSLRPTFGKHYDLNVTGGSIENIALERITGQAVVRIEDEIPSGAASLRIQFGIYPMDIAISTFNGIGTNHFDQTVDISGKVGTSNNEWRLNILSPIYGEEYETTYIITAKNSSNKVIGQATGTLPIRSNTKTLLHGELFTGTKSFVSLSTTWNADINVNM